MTKKIAHWPHAWPSNYKKNFSDNHWSLVEGWLSHSTSYMSLSDTNKIAIIDAIWRLDVLAWRMKRELKVGRPRIEHIRNSNILDVSPADRPRYLHNKPKVNCIDFCERARDAAFAGSWGAAIDMARNAGHESIGDLAAVARPILNARTNPNRIKRQKTATAERIEKIKKEAIALHQKNPRLSNIEIARKIHDRHKPKRGYSVDAIRRQFAGLWK